MHGAEGCFLARAVVQSPFLKKRQAIQQTEQNTAPAPCPFKASNVLFSISLKKMGTDSQSSFSTKRKTETVLG